MVLLTDAIVRSDSICMRCIVQIDWNMTIKTCQTISISISLQKMN